MVPNPVILEKAELQASYSVVAKLRQGSCVPCRSLPSCGRTADTARPLRFIYQSSSQGSFLSL